jgi:hypothetical protein
MTVWGGGNNVITSQGKHLDIYQRGKQRLLSLSYYWPDSLPGHYLLRLRHRLITVAG